MADPTDKSKLIASGAPPVAISATRGDSTMEVALDEVEEAPRPAKAPPVAASAPRIAIAAGDNLDMMLTELEVDVATSVPKREPTTPPSAPSSMGEIPHP